MRAGCFGLAYRRRAEPAMLADVDGHAVRSGEFALEVLRADGRVWLALGTVLRQDAVERLRVVHAETKMVDANLDLARLLVFNAQHGEIDLAVRQIDAVAA